MRLEDSLASVQRLRVRLHEMLGDVERDILANALAQHELDGEPQQAQQAQQGQRAHEDGALPGERLLWACPARCGCLGRHCVCAAQRQLSISAVQMQPRGTQVISQAGRGAGPPPQLQWGGPEQACVCRCKRA